MLTPIEITLLEEVEVFLRQIARLSVDDLLARGAEIHDAAQIYAEWAESVLDEHRK